MTSKIAQITLRVIFGFFLSLALLICIEVYFHFTDGRLRHFWNTDYERELDFPGGEGNGLRGGTRVNFYNQLDSGEIESISANMVYDNMREVIGADYRETRQTFVTILGGSNAFGDGLYSKDTIASNIQKACDHCNVYSFANGGFGPNTMLSQIESNYVQSKVKERTGTAIYFFIPAHVYRTSGAIDFIRYSHGVAPYYGWNSHGDDVERSGTFQSRYPIETRLKWLLGKSYLIYLSGIHLERWPITGWEKTCAVILKSQRIFNKQFSNSKFLVVYIDVWRSESEKQFVANDLRECLKDSAPSTEFVDLSTALKSPQHWISSKNHHINAAATKLIAEKLVNNYIATK